MAKRHILRYFGEDAFKKLKGDNKELYIVPGASHTDLYDNLEKNTVRQDSRVLQPIPEVI